MQSNFVAIVSHEFRTALTGIEGFSELMCEESLPPEEVKEYAADILTQARRLGPMIADLLDLERMKSGRMLLSLSQVDLGTLIREVLEPLRLTTPTHRFVLQLESTSPTCLGARDKLAQVLSNLLSNAIKYSPDGGAVVVGSQVVQEMAQVWVQDEGIGIPQKPWKQCLSPIVGLRQAPRAISKAQVSASLLLASSSRCKEDASGSKVAWGRVHVFPLPSRSPDSIRRKEEYMIVIRFRRNLGHLSVIFIRFQGKGWKSVVHLFHV